jgi:hypothetical protein
MAFSFKDQMIINNENISCFSFHGMNLSIFKNSRFYLSSRCFGGTNWATQDGDGSRLFGRSKYGSLLGNE